MSSRASSSRTRVGKYELGRTLGEGTFAKVKFARNVETGENVAIKILDKEKVLKHKMIGQVLVLIHYLPQKRKKKLSVLIEFSFLRCMWGIFCLVVDFFSV